MSQKTCAYTACGKPFLPRDKRQRFCSKRCAASIHGFFWRRQKVCEAPGCGKAYEAERLSARFCSAFCRLHWGRWSYAAEYHSNPRVFGEAR